MTDETTRVQTDGHLPSIGGDPSSAFDADRYRHLADKIEITEAQKDELLQTLFEIMKMFVDLGFSVNVMDNISPEIFSGDGYDDRKMLQSEPTNSKKEDIEDHG